MSGYQSIYQLINFSLIRFGCGYSVLQVGFVFLDAPNDILPDLVPMFSH